MKVAGNWKPLGSGVFERQDGARVHMLGIMLRRNGRIVPQDASAQDRWRRVAGGSTRRGMMLWANSIEPPAGREVVE